MTGSDLALYLNHRRFMEAQRGALTRHDEYDVIHGDVRDFQIAMLHASEALPQAARAAANIFAPPWARVDAGDHALGGLRYQLTHMSLAPGAMTAPGADPDVTIELVRNDEALRAFTHVQAAGFAKAEAYADVYAWMLSKNIPALAQPDQRFYLLRHKDEPVSVLLTVDTDDALGIYAVATLPVTRNRGFSGRLLAQVCGEAPTSKQVCLQVMRGSNAERLYAKLGFTERFIVDVHASALFE